ncbi:hypothetical protein BJV74DRAFT_810441 [Russula compacta]|nr:hypothetical protein BJV74DRAFT_810441 [Russula compacta]
MAARNDNDDRPTESTPLIVGRSTIHPRPSTSSLPSLTPVVNRIRVHGIRTVDEDLFLFHAHSASLAQQVSFKMVVFSQLYILAKAPPVNVGADVWEQWSRDRGPSLDAEDLQRRIIHVWEEFLEVSRNTQEIEECLWSPFALEEGKSLTVRVVDILKDPDAPPALLSHRLILLSLSHTWNRGRTLIPTGPLLCRILQRLRFIPTPRAVHAVDIFLQLGYLALLSDYVLHPPERPIITTSLNLIQAREVLLMIYSTASLLRSFTFLVAPYAFVAGAFFFTLPSTPFPGDTAYSILLGALLLHVLLLHLPRTPSPNFLLSPDVTLPLATLLCHEFPRILYPCVFFFLPATMLASFFLSIALQDSIPPFLAVFTLMEPAPMEIRIAFSVLWITFMLLITISSVLLMPFSVSFLSTSSQPVCSWDRYTAAVGLRSRRIFATAVAVYSVPYYFPPPFNLLQILFVHIPHLLSQLFGWKGSPVIKHIEGILWGLTTGPLASVVAACWF